MGWIILFKGLLWWDIGPLKWLRPLVYLIKIVIWIHFWLVVLISKELKGAFWWEFVFKKNMECYVFKSKIWVIFVFFYWQGLSKIYLYELYIILVVNMAYSNEFIIILWDLFMGEREGWLLLDKFWNFSLLCCYRFEKGEKWGNKNYDLIVQLPAHPEIFFLYFSDL